MVRLPAGFAGLLTLFVCCWTAACHRGGQEKRKIDPIPVSVASLPFEGDMPFLGYACDLTVVDSILYLQDVKGGGTLLRAFSYPSLKLLCSFVNRGHGPGEMLGVSGYTVDADSLRVFAANDHKMAVYAVSDIRQGVGTPSRMVEYPASCMPALAFGKVSDGFVLLHASPEHRLILIDDAGNVVAEKYKIPDPESDKSDIWPEARPYLWQSALASDGSVVVLGTRLGEVLEIYDLQDSSRNKIIRGEGGDPEAVVRGTMRQLGRINGFQELDMLDGKLYALYDGSELTIGGEVEDKPRKIFLRVYDLSAGELERVYELDRCISSFDILPDGRTVIAADPTSEQQLCTFTLPE